MSGIIVGVDGSGHSDRALDWAAREAALRQVPLTVLTVHQVAVGYTGTAIYLPADEAPTERARGLAQDRTDKVLAGLSAAPSQVTVRSVAGIPSQELLNAAKDADMLVVGSRGAGGFTQLLMGSVSAQVIHHAPCPVVVIPAEGRN
jgi:nucleotide-binding universal stress UspA family protein